ncbi:hypothetical protein TSMEX_007774 [Taenia solium]|eukprot:TsM_001033200 transcript=TsM_001033200 gene=TsM_001033200
MCESHRPEMDGYLCEQEEGEEASRRAGGQAGGRADEVVRYRLGNKVNMPHHLPLVLTRKMGRHMNAFIFSARDREETTIIDSIMANTDDSRRNGNGRSTPPPGELIDYLTPSGYLDLR